MSKIRTESNIQDVLDHDISWRIHEISFLKKTLRSANQKRKNSIVRAILPLLYAHWEGFVKKAASSYLEYVSNLRLCYCELNDSFIAIGLGNKFSSHGVKTKSIFGHLLSISFITKELSEKAKLPSAKIIDTKSNLNSSVLVEIFSTIGIDISNYQTKFNFIDQRLIKKRNSIAHGEFLDIDEYDLISTIDEVITLLRSVKNDIQNAVALKMYLKTTEQKH